MKKILLFIITFLITASAYAGDVARKGTTGAEQLLIPVGARSIATGGSFLANLTGLNQFIITLQGLM